MRYQLHSSYDHQNEQVFEILVMCWLSMKCKEKEISDSGWWMHMRIHLNEISAAFLLGPSKWTSTRNSCYVLIVNEMQRERNFWLWLMNAYENTFKWDISCIPLMTIKMNKYLKFLLCVDCQWDFLTLVDECIWEYI